MEVTRLSSKSQNIIPMVLRQAHQWAEVYQPGKGALRSWEPSALKARSYFTSAGNELRIVELTDAVALWREGGRMNNCVASYRRACLAGFSRIWSMRLLRVDELPKSVLTIEFNQTLNTVVQVKGRGNRAPRTFELGLVKKWATEQGAKVDLHY